MSKKDFTPSIQTNTGKQKDVFLQIPFKDLTWIEMRREIAKQEKVPAAAIQLVGYDKDKWNFDIS